MLSTPTKDQVHEIKRPNAHIVVHVLIKLLFLLKNRIPFLI